MRSSPLEHLSLDGFLAGPNGEMDWIRVDDALFDYGSAIFATPIPLFSAIPRSP